MASFYCKDAGRKKSMSSESLASIDVTPSVRMRQGTSASVMSNYSPNSWLLRLFQSEFFDIRFAVLYLAKYLKVIGIQNYICKELSKFPEDMLLSILPQLCHLLITRTTEAVCIESLLLDKCKDSAHVAIQTLWHLEANFLDAQKTRPDTPSLLNAKRLVHEFHQHIFKPKASATLMFPSAMALNQPPPIRDHVPPILIGVGAIFASFACPSIPASVQGLLRRQGQRPRVPSLAEVGKQASSIQDNESVQGDSTVATPRESVSAKRESTNGAPADSTASTMNKDFAMMALDNIRSSFVKSTNGSSASLEELATGLAFSKRKKTTTSPFLSKRNSGLSPDAGTEFASTVSHYFYSETQFLLTLVEISDRLVSVPKPARQSTLVAELTLFNHNLPADVCLPLWCPYTSEHPYHHQVVRVSPSDAVVLNSAERVPYLILVEVVEQRGPKDAKELSRKVSSTCSPQMSNIDPGDLSTSKIELMENVQRINQFLRRGSDNSLPPSSPLSGRASVPSVQVAEAVTPQRALKSPNVASPPPMSPSTSSQPPPSDINIRMRTAAVMLAQLYQHQNAQNQGKKVNTQAQTLFNDIRAKLIQEMMDLETVRVAGLESNAGEDLSERNSVSNAGSPDHYAAEDVVPAKPPNKDTDDPSAAVFREPWSVKKERIRQASPYGHNVNWNLLSVIVKSGADLRQEQIALQLIYEMDRVWKEDAIPVWIYNFKILIMSDDCGLIETIQDAISIHSIKKQGYKRLPQDKTTYSLHDYFLEEYRDPDKLQSARECFMMSLAGYSIVCYLLQIKDRHNGNILIDAEGHCIHIDFGFMLSNSPGSVGFELAPFKLSTEYIDILGGVGSPLFERFIEVLTEAFLSLRKKADWLVGLVEIMESGSRLPCFTGVTKPTPGKDKESNPTSSNPSKSVSLALRERFQLGLTDAQVGEHMRKLVQSSANNSFTRLYDMFQYYANEIL